MLKRNKMLIAFMLVAVMCMSIGFAAISDTLIANGTLSLNVDDEEGDGGLTDDFNEDIYFSAASKDVTKAGADGVTITTDFTSNPDEISIGIDNTTFTKVGQSVTVTATITNDAPYAVALAAPTITNVNSQYFTVSANFAGDDTTTVNANGTTTLTITVTLDALPASSLENVAFTVSVAATPAK